MTSKAGLLSRRNIVLGGAVAAAGGAYGASASTLGASWFRTVQKTGANVLGIELTPHGGIAHWRSMVGQEFYVQTQSGTLQTKLASVEALNDGGEGRPLGLARDEAFCCLFDTGRQQPPEGSATYAVAHRELGRTQIHMSCCKTPRRLEAVFN
jgi:hypothetical protein